MSSSQRRWSHLCMLIALLGSFVGSPIPAHADAGTYVVDNVGDNDYDVSNPPDPLPCENDAQDNDCSLRQAINRANTDDIDSTITFNLPIGSIDPNGATWTIQLASPLPEITEDGTTIDGTNFDGDPSVILNGESLPNSVGLRIDESAGNIIKGMIIINFKGSDSTTGIGIRIDGKGSTGNRIVGNYIGNVFGEADTENPTKYGNQRAGIQIDAEASENVIGGTTSEERNYISGNKGDGILLSTKTLSNTIQGNYIGLVRVGNSVFKLGNAGDGIEITDSNNNIVGGTTAAQRNIISGNGENGVVIAGDDSTNNTIAGNYIGTDQNGFLDRGNAGDGIRIANKASNNTISGSSIAPSVISANGEYGILIRDRDTTGNVVTGSYVGVNKDGNLDGSDDLGNASGGIRIEDDASNNVIGGSIFGTNERNVISGNRNYGISLGRTTAGFISVVSNTIAGNYIGVNFDGTEIISNTLGGILVEVPARETRIGGTSESERNLIRGNGGDGIRVIGTDTTDVPSTLVFKNIIEANEGYGVSIVNADQTLIDGQDDETPNTIANNSLDGIFLDNATNTTIRNSLIQENAANGIQVTGSVSATIEFNEVFTNTLDGVLVGSDSQGIALLNNRMTGNGELGIDLDPDTPAPGSASNPNHDIDPPFDLRINQNGLVSGLVLTDTQQAAACLTCLIQVFTTNPETRDGQGLDFVVAAEANPDGSFSAELGFAPEDATQLALTATDVDADEQRNTSEFVTFEITRSVVIEPPRTTIDAIPTQVITYFHTVTNTGTVEDEFVLSGVSSLGLDFGIEPAEAFTLEAGETQEVTVTLTLPIGSDERVRAGNTDLLTITVTSTSDDTVTDSVVDTTSIAGKIVITVDPAASNGLTRAGERLDYAHIIRNVGNIAATLDLTLDLSETPANWKTNLSENTFTLGPGQSAQPVLSITSPESALAGLSATTYISVTVREDATENKIITDTTTVTTTAAVFIVPSSITFDGAAGKVTSFQHTITNISNGPVTLQLRGTTSLGSQVSFQAISSDIQFGPDNTVTIPVEDGRNVFTFQANVLIPESAGRGQEDVLTLQVIDASTGNIIASVQDITRVVIGRVKLWLPIAGRTM